MTQRESGSQELGLEGRIKQVENRIWALWLASGSDTANLLMTRTKAAIDAKDLDLAVQLLDSIIKIKTGPDRYKFTDMEYVGNGNLPEQTEKPAQEELLINPSTAVVKLLDLEEMVNQIQHEIWEASIEEGESYSDILDRVIENTSDFKDQDVELINRVAKMIRNAREEQEEDDQ